MGTYREQDPLVTHLVREEARVLECISGFASGEGAVRLAEARRIIRALGDAEAAVLYPAFSRVAQRLETERLLEDSRSNRVQQLEMLDVLAHKRAPRLRKLKAVELCDLLRHHGEQHTTLLVPVLASQLPRALYRSIVGAFMTRYEAASHPTPVRATPAALEPSAADQA